MSLLSNIIVTRTQPGCDALVLRLAALGYNAVAAPLLRAEATHTPAPCDIHAIEGVLLTSSQALRFLPSHFPRTIPLYAVGYASAEAARLAGFTHVYDGGGDVRALGQAVRATNPRGLWVHITTTEPADGTAEALQGIGETLLNWPIYRTVENAFDTRIFEDAAFLTVHSVKAARVLAKAVQVYGKPEIVQKMSLLCLSPAVLECLATSGFKHLYVSETPDENALITLLRSVHPVPPR